MLVEDDLGIAGLKFGEISADARVGLCAPLAVVLEDPVRLLRPARRRGR